MRNLGDLSIYALSPIGDVGPCSKLAWRPFPESSAGCIPDAPPIRNQRAAANGGQPCDYLRLAEMWELKGDVTAANKLRQTVPQCALMQAEQFGAANNVSAVEANLKFYRECVHFMPIATKRRRVRSALARLPQFLKIMVSGLNHLRERAN